MRLRTGITAAHAAEKLGELRRGLQEPRNRPDEPFLDPRWEYREAISLKVNAYLDWAQTAETQMRALFTDTDLADAVFADRYWHIAGLHAGSPYGVRIINQEVDHQDARLAEAIETLKQWQELGSARVRFSPWTPTRSCNSSVLRDPVDGPGWYGPGAARPHHAGPR